MVVLNWHTLSHADRVALLRKAQKLHTSVPRAVRQVISNRRIEEIKDMYDSTVTMFVDLVLELNPLVMSVSTSTSMEHSRRRIHAA